MIRGVGLSIEDDQNGGPAREPQPKPMKRKRVDSARDVNVGAALRSVYTETVNESVPNEFMDLLRKLD